jgi:TPR repeat protein
MTVTANRLASLGASLLLSVAACQPAAAGEPAKCQGDTPASELVARATAGEARCQYVLGLAHKYGTDVAADREAAIAWFEKAGAQGYQDAVLQLVDYFNAGPGKDDRQWLRWRRHQAERGDPYAQYEVGDAYERGRGTPVDPVAAMRWLRLASEDGRPPPCFGSCRDSNRPAGGPAKFRIGQMYRYGIGVRADEAEAQRWYRLAASIWDGNGSGQLALWRAYAFGLGVPKDEVLASQWLQQAIEEGSAPALVVYAFQKDRSYPSYQGLLTEVLNRWLDPGEHWADVVPNLTRNGLKTPITNAEMFSSEIMARLAREIASNSRPANVVKAMALLEVAQSLDPAPGSMAAYVAMEVQSRDANLKARAKALAERMRKGSVTRELELFALEAQDAYVTGRSSPARPRPASPAPR